MLLTTRGVEYELLLLLGRVYVLLWVERVAERVYAGLRVVAAFVDSRVKLEADDVLLLSDKTLPSVPDFVVAPLDVAVVLLPMLAPFVPSTFVLLFALELDAETADEPPDPPLLFIFVSVDLL